MEEGDEHMGKTCPDTPGSRFVAQPVDNFLFFWEKRSVENPFIIEEDDEFSEPRILISEPPIKPPPLEAKPALRSIDNSAARQLFDL